MPEPSEQGSSPGQEKALRALIAHIDAGDARAGERHRALIARIDAGDARAEERHRALMERHEELKREGAERHRALMERHRRGERIFVEAFGDIDASIQRNTYRLDDMGEAIRADTRAVLSVLDRLEPPSG
ncbi:MAG: hypothetical protein ACRDK9_02665 [Solirubrobacterales bacterium]